MEDVVGVEDKDKKNNKYLSSWLFCCLRSDLIWSHWAKKAARNSSKNGSWLPSLKACNMHGSLEVSLNLGLETVSLFSCWTSSDMVIFSRIGPAASSLTISSLWDLVKEGGSSGWCRRFSGLSWGSETPSMALLVLSSATGDAKLNSTEAALTDGSAGDEVWDGSPHH